MSNVLTEYAPFIVYDYTNSNVLSTYNLDITPLKFVPFIPYNHNTEKVIWDFGDNTTSHDVTAFHVYNFPGVYDVNLFITNCADQTKYSTYAISVSVNEYLSNTITIVSPDDNILSAYNGVPTNAIQLYKQTNRFYDSLDVFYSVSGSETPDYFSLVPYKFNHLQTSHSVCELSYNRALSTYEYIEVDKIITDDTKLYVKLENGSLVPCNEEDNGSIYIGLSGTKTIYYKDDLPTDKFLLSFFLDKEKVYDATILSDADYVKYLNLLNVTLSGVIFSNPNVSRFSITSNGLDGEGFIIDTFNIAPYKFKGTNIPFVIKIKDTDNYSVKNFPLITDLNISLIVGDEYALTEDGEFFLTETDNEYLLFTATNSYLSSLSAVSISASISSIINEGGYYRGYFNYANDNEMFFNCYLSCFGTVINNEGTAFNISGQSSLFDLYPQNYYQLYKINENYDMTETFKNLRFQEFLLDKNILFNDFLGSIFGTEASDHNALGKKIWERITNYTDNISNIDKQEIKALYSLLQMIDYYGNKYDANDLNYPMELKRIVNMLSIVKNRLFGYKNQFKENFDPKGHTTKDTYGINLGDQINTATYMVTAGVDIVALERFSNTYTRLNTQQPLSSNIIDRPDSYVYPLSELSLNWGWPLILPDNYVYKNLDKFYFFFEFVDQIDGTTLGNTIDFDNPLTVNPIQQLSLDQLISANGVYEMIIANTLYNALSLFC
jgi:PKD repeat protein